MARGRATKRWHKPKAATAQTLSPAANVPDAANDDAPGSAIVDSLMALFPPAAVAGSLAKRAPIAVARRAARIARSMPPEPVRAEPTPEQLRRGTYALAKTKDPDNAAPIEVRRNAAAPIDRWRARGQLTPRQFDAADRYRQDYARGGYERSVISRYDGGGGSGDGTPNLTGTLAGTVAQIAARDRLREARAQLPKRLASWFDEIVLYEADPTGVGGELGASGPRRAALAIFNVAVCADILGDWYRLTE